MTKPLPLNALDSYEGLGDFEFAATYKVCGTDTIPAGTTFELWLTPDSYWDSMTLVSTSLPLGTYTPIIGDSAVTLTGTDQPTLTWGGTGCMGGLSDVRYAGRWTINQDHQLTPVNGCVQFTARFKARLRLNAKALPAHQNAYYAASLNVRTLVKLTLPAVDCVTVTGELGASDFYNLKVNGTRPNC